ncbi:MAG: hypothetical protein GX982_06550 [Tissierellia bacterium]|nr:hypothetical protein [Tissierellia bacterium]
MYQLYLDKDKCILEIKKLSKVFKNVEIEEDLFQYNDCYYFGKNRKVLKDKAKEIKKRWQSEAENRLEKVKNIKI